MNQNLGMTCSMTNVYLAVLKNVYFLKKNKQERMKVGTLLLPTCLEVGVVPNLVS